MKDVKAYSKAVITLAAKFGTVVIVYGFINSACKDYGNLIKLPALLSGTMITKHINETIIDKVLHDVM